MTLDVHWKRSDDVLIGVLTGRIDTGSSDTLQRTLDSEIGPDSATLILDLAQVSYISSAGLRVCMGAAKRFRGDGRHFGICALSKSVRDVVSISGFDQIIAVYESQSEALLAFAQD